MSLTEESKKTIGSILESLKKLYSTDVKLFNEITSSAKNFVEKQKGVWDHAKWEEFLSDIQKKGMSLTEESKKTIGSILESLKKFYQPSPKKKALTEEKKEEVKEEKKEEAKKIEKQEEAPLKKEKKKEEKKVAKKPKKTKKAVEAEVSEKEKILTTLEDELGQWKEKIDILKAKEEKVKEEHKAEYEKHLNDVLLKEKEAEDMFKRLKSAGDKEWEEVKEGVDKAWKELEDAINRALEKFS